MCTRNGAISQNEHKYRLERMYVLKIKSKFKKSNEKESQDNNKRVTAKYVPKHYEFLLFQSNHVTFFKECDTTMIQPLL